MERRREPRVKCSIDCEVVSGDSRGEGTVVDVSPKGLCVRTEAEVGEGSAVTVRITPAGHEVVEVSGIVWHLRRVRARRGGAISRSLGVVLSEISPAFEALWQRLAPKTSAKRRKSDGRRRAGPTGPPAESTGPAQRAFRVRVRADDAPRSRWVTVEAADAEAAQRAALAKIGEGWTVIEVTSG